MRRAETTRRFLVILGASLLGGTPARAADPPTISGGAIEVGGAGTLVTTAGASTTQVALRSGWFLGAGPGLVGFEGEALYGRMREHDQLDLTAIADFVYPIQGTTILPFVGATAGYRQEWLGSFSNAMWSVGGVVGLRALASSRVGLRVDYRFRRVLDDHGLEFTEQALLFGLSIFFRNEPGAD